MKRYSEEWYEAGDWKDHFLRDDGHYLQKRRDEIASDAGQQAAEDRRYDFSPPDRYGKIACGHCGGGDNEVGVVAYNDTFGFICAECLSGKACRYCHGEGVVGTEFVVGMGPCDAPCPVCGEE